MAIRNKNSWVVVVFLILAMISFSEGKERGDKGTDSGQGQERLMIKFQPEISAALIQSFSKRFDLRHEKSIKELRVHIFTVQSKESLAKLLAKIKKSPAVVYAEVIQQVKHFPNKKQASRLRATRIT